MRCSTLALGPFAFFLVAVASAGSATAAGRWIPPSCVELLAAGGTGDTGIAAQATPAAREAIWNEAYRAGFRAIEDEAFDDAEREMCRALVAAREFGPRDWRFAETLDEMGLVAFQVRDFELAETVQGAAIAEMLLAVGPHGEPFRGEGPSDHSPARADCASGVRVYTARLGWIQERTPGRIDVEMLERAPWRVFWAGYVPLDDALADRLGWLISRYLLEENLAAAEELSALQREIRESAHEGPLAAPGDPDEFMRSRRGAASVSDRPGTGRAPNRSRDD